MIFNVHFLDRCEMDSNEDEKEDRVKQYGAI